MSRLVVVAALVAACSGCVRSGLPDRPTETWAGPPFWVGPNEVARLEFERHSGDVKGTFHRIARFVESISSPNSVGPPMHATVRGAAEAYDRGHYDLAAYSPADRAVWLSDLDDREVVCAYVDSAVWPRYTVSPAVDADSASQRLLAAAGDERAMLYTGTSAWPGCSLSCLPPGPDAGARPCFGLPEAVWCAKGEVVALRHGPGGRAEVAELRPNGQPYVPLPSRGGDRTLIAGRFVSRERVLLLTSPEGRAAVHAVLWDWKTQGVREWALEGVGDDAVLSLDGKRVAWTVGGTGLSSTIAMRRLEW